MKSSIAVAMALFLGCPTHAGKQQEQNVPLTTLRGWLSDEQCAHARATGGIYTGTNPECANRCVGEGKNVVLILPEQKEILLITNQEIAKKNVGDYVEVTGNILHDNSSLHISTLKLLEHGRAMCDVPKSAKKSGRKN
jgi:hypothetical protein